MIKKGIILCGGHGTRMRPATKIYNKHLAPILNKPMVLYPIETLKKLGITDIMIITGGEAIGGFAEFLQDGSEYGINLTYRVQTSASGIAHALALAKDFVKGEKSFAVILGDNVFDNRQVKLPPKYKHGVTVLYGKEVVDPERFGVLCADMHGNVKEIEEKPKKPKSNIAITGLYIYPTNVFDVIKTLKPSARGELEITDVNNHYVKRNHCQVVRLDDFWSDAGTPESFYRTNKWAFDKLPAKGYLAKDHKIKKIIN